MSRLIGMMMMMMMMMLMLVMLMLKKKLLLIIIVSKSNLSRSLFLILTWLYTQSETSSIMSYLKWAKKMRSQFKVLFSWVLFWVKIKKPNLNFKNYFFILSILPVPEFLLKLEKLLTFNFCSILVKKYHHRNDIHTHLCQHHHHHQRFDLKVFWSIRRKVFIVRLVIKWPLLLSPFN